MANNPPVYQLKILLRGMKPPVWRRVLVTGDSTLRFLHEILQVTMGWYNCHLHQFSIRGKEYGVSYEDGVSFDDGPDDVRLSDFQFPPTEKFEYRYDFGDNWEHTLTVEKILPADPAQTYPLCIGGRGECPPEDSGGPWGYMERRQSKSGEDGSLDTRAFEAEQVNQFLRDLHTGWFTRPKSVGY